MDGFSIFFAALTVLNALRFLKTKDRWYLALGLLFGLMLIRGRVPEGIFTVLLAGLLIWVVWLGAFKFIPSLRLRRLLANPSLKSLTDEERKWRAALEDWEQDYIANCEFVTESRLSMPEAVEHLESARRSRKERAAYLAEMAAEEEKEHAAEAERIDLEISAVSSQLMAMDSTGRECAWLKLEPVDGPDDEDSGMVGCTVWSHEPKPNEPGASSFLSLSSVLGFPPEASVSKPVFWTSMSPALREMFKSRCLVTNVGMMDDGRERFEFRVEDRVFVIMTKYLAWQTDMALDSDQQRVWVRISGMSSELWVENNDEEGNPQSRFLDFDRIPAFLYPVSVDQILPSTNPDAHFASMEERYE